MKLNSTIGLTLLLLTAMLAAGIFSAVAGMSVGREALKGITQPDTRPTNNLANRKGDGRNSDFAILQEDKILGTVKARMGGKAANVAPKPVAAAPQPEVGKLPITAESQGISLQVKTVQRRGDALVLSLSLKNETNDPVKFLYTFLEVKTDQGQVLSSTTEGLPAELPPDSADYSGTIRLPVTSLNNAKSVSLALADYPDQQIQLKLSNIPIAR